jgi:hypothetical protein
MAKRAGTVSDTCGVDAFSPCNYDMPGMRNQPLVVRIAQD